MRPQSRGPYKSQNKTSQEFRSSEDTPVQSFLEEVMGEEMVLDGTIAQDSAQIAGIWGIREGISVALKHAGAK